MPKIRDFNRVTALYERLSKDDEQQGESNSILNQKRFLEDFARKSGMTNIKHFTDDGYTGRNFNRPGFQAMLAEAEAGKIGTIIVKDMSRFGRNYLEVGFYTEILFPKKQIRFVAINNSVDSDKPQDNDFTPFLNIMNEWYAKDTSNKIKSIFLSRMNDGKRCSGSIPYGYNRLPEDKQTLVVDPVASQVVKHIFELAAEGLTPPAIARQLTEEKVLIPSAYTLQYHPEQCNRKAAYGCTSWNANTVREILSRQEYLGHTVLRKTIGTNFKTDERRFATDEERLVFEDTHEPIVDSELWELAHRRLKHATRRIKEGTHQEEAKAERWAANDGHKYPKRVCEQCGKEFYPSSTRQRFCNTDCTKAHQQAEKEKKRYAEKGEHTFRQKVCKICGKPFWPSNGQEVLCSEECKTINRNQRQLAYYHRKQSGQKAGEAI